MRFLFASTTWLSLSLFATNASCGEAFAPGTHRLSTYSRVASNIATTTNLHVSTSTSTTTALEELSKLTTISIDSGDLDIVEKYAKTGLVTDATTNPLFVSQAGSNGDKRYEDMVFDAIMYSKEQLGGGDSPMADFEPEINLAMDKLAVNLGAQLSKLVPGRVSTEVDIRLSYDIEASVERARGIIKMYEAMGVDRSRILIKLAGTWEGIQAARILEKENIQCNITLVFSFLQAAAAAQAGAYLVSPFPGRILDWARSKGAKESFHPTADPGVLLIKRMYSYFKRYGYKTICMPASWRPSRGTGVPGSDVDEILALVGVDEMTIPPQLLESLLQRDGTEVTQALDASVDAVLCCDPDFILDEKTFKAYWETDTCGREKLDEGIAAFTKNTVELREILYSKFAEG
jgi:transaldolase